MIFDKKKKKNSEISKIFHFKNKIIHRNTDSFFLKVGPHGWNPGRLRMSTTLMAEVHVRRLLLH